MTRKNLYFLLLFLGIAGQIWIVYSYIKLEQQEDSFNICLFKRVTSLPCPSCGTIHSIVSILHGDFREALSENPLGFPDLLLVAIVPFWILGDLVFRNESFYKIFLRTEEVLRMKGILFALLSVIFMIWLYKLGQALLWI